MHDATKHALGTTKGPGKPTVTNHKGAAVIAAGIAVRLKSDDTPAIATGSGVGELIGISLGRDLSDTGRTAVCRAGLGVPLKIASGVTPAPGETVYIVNATGEGHNSADAARTATAAVYASEKLTTGGMAEGESSGSVDFAYVDMVGGL